MKRWGKFRTLKERGEWVELVFMAAAASHGYHVLKPSGDSRAYDVAIEHGGDLIRVQVKSTTKRANTGYSSQFRRSDGAKKPYTLDEVDFFAVYIVPLSVWYLIPAVVVLRPIRRVAVTLCPLPQEGSRCKYEHYREAWGLLGKSRRDLARTGKRR
jgi:hypothetical protein